MLHDCIHQGCAEPTRSTDSFTEPALSGFPRGRWHVGQLLLVVSLWGVGVLQEWRVGGITLTHVIHSLLCAREIAGMLSQDLGIGCQPY